MNPRMSTSLKVSGLPWLSFILLAAPFLDPCAARGEPPPVQPPLWAIAGSSRDAFLVIPGPTNQVRLRLYTNASPDSTRLFNTFEIDAYGETLLRSPGGASLKQWLAAAPSNVFLHNILVNGAGPRLASSNGMAIVAEVAGPGWRYVALDVSSAYAVQLKEFRRGILYVEPDLFVIYDHLIAREPSRFQMVLHPPSEARVDPVWHDLRLDLPAAGFRIHAPALQKKLRSWERIASPADSFLPNTVTMQLGPTNQLVQLDLLTALVVHPGRQQKELAFRLLEGSNAIGARIHRDGLPTLIAFRIDPAREQPSLTGFSFAGPVGVDIFKLRTAR
jgi:hypothetical protein